MKSCINIEYSYYKLVNNVQVFNQKWGVNQCICEVDSEDCLKGQFMVLCLYLYYICCIIFYTYICFIYVWVKNKNSHDVFLKL